MTQNNIRLLDKIVKYTETENDILFLGLIGSSSNDEKLNDEYSDIDLLLVTDSLIKYYNNDTWLSSIDNVWITFTESAANINYWERRCIFINGLDVDFVIIDKDKLLDVNSQFPVLNDICRKTLQVLLDKGNYVECFNRFVSSKKNSYIEPTQDEYNNLINDFYFHYLWTYKKCLRGEYWTALQCVNGYLKNKTLRLIEWYEHSIHGKEYNTFYQGRYIENWSEEFIVREFEKIYSAYGKESIINALNANMLLFSRLAKEVSKLNSLTFPEQNIEKLIEWVKATYKNG